MKKNINKAINKKILAFILSGCMFIQNSGALVQAAELPLYTQTETGDANSADSGSTEDNTSSGASKTDGKEDAAGVDGESAGNKASSGNPKTEGKEGEEGIDSDLASDKESSGSPKTEGKEDEDSTAGDSMEDKESNKDNESAEESAEDGELSGNHDSEDSSEATSETETNENPEQNMTSVSENAVSENAVSENAVSEDVNSEDAESEDINSEDAESEDINSEDTKSEDVGEGISIPAAQVEESIPDIQYAYFPMQQDIDSQQDTDSQQTVSQSIDTAKGLYFGYVENDSKTHTGTLEEYISDSSTVVVPHKLGKSYMVEIGDSVFAGMDETDPSDTSKLPGQSTTDKTLLNSGETKILELLNAERIKDGKVPLVMSSTLRETARRKSLDMLNKNYFSHEDPNGVLSYKWLGDCGYPLNSCSWGENIAYNYESAEKLFTQWWKSPGHHANMMNGSFRAIGIGVYKGKDGKIMGTQVFTSRVFQNITNVTIEFGYEKIGNRAFANCSNLKTITIPSTVSEIAANAFDGCNKLTIRGKEGSYAQTYAQAHGITFNAVKETWPIGKFAFEEKEIFLEVDDWDFAAINITPAEYAHLIKTSKTETPEKNGSQVIDYQEDGTVHALSKGTAVIKARIVDTEVTCTITVGEPEAVPIKNISFYDEELILYKDETIRPAYRIEPFNTTDKVQLLSSNKDIFVVNEDDASLITGIKPGNAVLTVSKITEDNTVSVIASINVKVLTKDETLELPEGLKAVTNITPTLAGVALPEGFSWKEPQTKLKAGKDAVQYFAAQYQNDDKCILQDCVLPVEVSAATGMIIEMYGKTLPASTKLSLLESYELTVSVKSKGAMVDSSFLDVESSVSDSGIMEIEKQTKDNNLTLLLTPKKAGKCSVTITVKLKDENGYGPSNKPYGTYKKKYNFQVENSAYASDFQVKLEPETQSGVTILGDGSIQVEENATKFRVRVTALDINGNAKNTALKFKADKSKIVKVKAVKGQNGLIEVNVKKTGDAFITVTSQDGGKRSKNIAINVKKTAPQLNGKTWTLNKLKPAVAVPLDIQAAEDNPIQNIILYEDKETKKVANLFDAVYNDETDSYGIGFKSQDAPDATKKSYKLFLKAFTGAGDYVYPVTVRLKNSKPSIKLKQSAQINIFYKDAQADLAISTGTDRISDIVQTNIPNNKPHFEAEFSKDDDGIWSARIYPVDVTAANYKKVAKTIELKVSFQDYANTFTIIKKLSVKSCYQKAALVPASSQNFIYTETGNDQTVFQIKEKASGNLLTMGGDNNIGIWLDKSMADKVELTSNADEQDIRIKMLGTKKKSMNVKVMVTHDNWRESVPCIVKLTVNTKTPSLELDKAKISLNTNEVGKETINIKASVSKNYDMDIVRLRAADIVGTSSAARKMLSENKIIIYPQKDGTKRSLKVCLNSSDVRKGTYKYKIYAWCMRGEKQIQPMNPMTLSITVTNKQPAVSMKAKGKINISNPKDTSIIYTPKLLNVNGDIRSIKLSGGYSSEFILTKLENGTYKVNLREDSKLIKGKYKIYFTIVLENGIKIESKAVTIKL